MPEGYAIIISAVISVGRIVLTQFFNYIQRKRDIIDRFYFEFHQKRIEVYDDAINELNHICKNGKIYEKIKSTNDVIYKRLLSDIHKLNILCSRLTLFGSPSAAGIIASLCKAGMELEITLMKPITEKCLVFSVPYRDFIILIEETIVEFSRHTSRETAAEYIDEKTAHIFKKFIKKPCRRKKKK